VFANKELILESIRTLFETRVKPALAGRNPFPAESYFADYAVVFRMNEARVVGAEAVLIELNRFNSQPGAALFDWGRDLEVLIGVKLFEFRIRTEAEIAEIDWDVHISGSWGRSVWQIMRRVRSDIVQSQKAWYEELFTWRNNANPG
jgi:hypothetical protein